MASLIRPATRVHNSRPFLLAEQLLGRSQASEPQMRRSSPQHAVNAADTLSLPATRGSVAVYTVASDTTWVDRVSMKQSAQEDARTQIDRLFDLPDARMPNKDLPRVPLEHFPLVDNPAAYLLANSSLAPSFHFMPMTLLQETVVQTVRKQVVVELERQRVALSKQGASTTQSGQQAAQGLVQSAVNGIIDDKVVHLLLNKLQAAMQEERFRQGWIH